MPSFHFFYVPKTKQALVHWIHTYGKGHRNPADPLLTPEQEKAIVKGWNRLTKKQLYAVFFKLRDKHENPTTPTARIQKELF